MTAAVRTGGQGHYSQILARQCEALQELAYQYPERAHDLVAAIVAATGRIIFTGMGKSGHTARLLSATFSSVGLPALFLHPSEALHGDIGGVMAGDICICLSKSGYGSELEAVLERVHALAVPTFLLTCGTGSLTALVNSVIHLPLSSEAGPYNLVPTCSVLVTLAFGQIVALEAALKKGFNPDSFARVHPAGAIGQKLQTKELL